jgi:hypothetical protein
MTDCEQLLGIQRLLNGKHRNSLLKIFCRLIDHRVVTRALLHFELQRRRLDGPGLPASRFLYASDKQPTPSFSKALLAASPPLKLSSCPSEYPL